MKDFARANWFAILVAGVILPWATWVTVEVNALERKQAVTTQRVETLDMQRLAALEKALNDGRKERLDFQREVIDRLARIETTLKGGKP